MFWIVETQDQFKNLLNTLGNGIFLELISNNDNFHASNSTVSVVYLYDIRHKKSYILPIDHSESSSELSLEDIMGSLSQDIKIFTYDKKRLLHLYNKIENIFCIKTSYSIYNMKFSIIENFNTPIHEFFYHKYPHKENINSIIPLSKHYEKFTNLIRSIDFKALHFSGRTYEFYNELVVSTFCNLENSGIKLDIEKFNHYFNSTKKHLPIKDSIIYSNYNLCLEAVRPSNTFDHINFLALSKKTGEREAFVSNNDFFVEFDYNSFHPRILGELVNYDFGEDDVYDHIGNFIHNGEYSSDNQRSEIKKIMFVTLYNEESISHDHEYFNKIIDLKNYLWENYQTKGYIKSPISGRKLINIDSKRKILPYLCQMLETEKNVVSLQSIQNELIGKRSKLVLYTYDSFLIDYSKKDGKQVLENIKSILEQNKNGYRYPVNIKYGKDYNNLRKIN